jgi:hypothetical protein
MTFSSDIPELDADSARAIPGKQEPVQKMTVGEIFSRSWEIYKTYPVIIVPSLIPALWAFVGMTFLMAGVAGWALFGDMSYLSFFAAASMMGWMMLFLIVLVVLFIIAQGLTIEMIRGALRGQNVNLSSSWEASKSKMATLIFASILSSISIAVGYMLLLIPGLILTAVLYFVAQAVMIDESGVIESLSASYRFVRANLEDSVVIIIISMAIGLVLAAIPAIGPILSLLSLPYIYALATLLYLDRSPQTA